METMLPFVLSCAIILVQVSGGIKTNAKGVTAGRLPLQAKKQRDTENHQMASIYLVTSGQVWVFVFL